MISSTDLEEFKEIFKKEYGYEFKSDAEARDAAERLASVFEIIFEAAAREHKRKRRLKKEPNGFHLDENEGTYNCIICHTTIKGEQTWWDENGVKCMDCQRALENKVVPKSVCSNRDSWYASWELTNEHGLHSSTIRKLIREGKLRPRCLTTKEGAIYYQLFIKKENKHLLSLKKSDKKLKVIVERA